jgi:hypothetical protein
LKASEKVYWIKTALGLLTGVICYHLQSAFTVQGQVIVMIGATLYIAYSEALAILTEVDRNRTIKIAIGAFLFIWILTWTLLNTLGHYGWI